MRLYKYIIKQKNQKDYNVGIVQAFNPFVAEENLKKFYNEKDLEIAEIKEIDFSKYEILEII